MDNNTTPYEQQRPKNNSIGNNTPHVSKKTLALLRSFAANYTVEPKLPQGIQGIILG